ncbi:MAG: GAF domain-containing protein [Gemmatimonadaceae bacterium]|nr:GAF domain-containing protein [Gemmatimonadaceae bacterium]
MSSRPASATRTTPGAESVTEAAHRSLETLAPDDVVAVRRLFAIGERRAVELQHLQHITTALSRTLDEETILDEVVRGTLRALGGSGAMVVLAGEQGQGMQTRRHLGADGDRPLIPLRTDAGAFAGSVLAGGPRLFTRALDADGEAIDLTMGTEHQIDALVVVPMLQGHNLVGAIVAYAADAHAFDAETREFLVTIAVTSGTALRNARLYAESERERRQSDAMAEVARAAGESLRVTEVQRLIMRHAMALLRAEGCCVAMRDGDYLHVESATGTTSVMAGVVMPVQSSLIGRAVRTGEPTISNDVRAEPENAQPGLPLVDVTKAVIVPLRTARGVIGALSVYDREDPFRAADLRILQRLADQVTVAIVNSRLFTDIQETTREWSSTFDAMGVGMAVVNDEGRVLRCNARARQLSGDEWGLMGRPFYQALLGVEQPGDPNPLRVAIDDGARSRARMHSADRARLFDVHAAPHLDGGAVVTFDLVEG